MATLTEKPASKHQGFIRERLESTLRRIRFLDLTTGLLGLVALLLAYLACMIGLDVIFRLADGTRQVFTLFFLLGTAAYAWFWVIRPLRREINPHYAARQLEQSAGEGRHHVVNWIDLENQPVPAVYRITLDRRTARDLEEAEPEQAISNRPLYLVGGLTAALFLGVVILFILLGPGPFGAYFGRALGRAVAIPPRTTIELLRPETGDSVVTIGNPVVFVVKISGYHARPNHADAPTLHFWQEADQTPRTRPLTLSGTDEWSVTLGPLEVGNGFFYHLTAGDAQTPDYRIRVRASANLTDFRATYRYRRYLNLADKVRTVRAIEEVRGTEVFLEGKPNREVREATLEFTDAAGKLRFQRGEVTPQGLRWRLVLDQPGSYRLSYVATTGEAFRDAASHPITILPDAGPRVTFTEPAKEVSIPLNSQLSLKAEIKDDVGIAAVTLKIKRVDGTDLPDMPYLAGKLGTPALGTPRTLSYQELLIPAKLDESLKPGTVLEYWLEARDACDFPQPNMGVSQRYRVTLTGMGDAAAEKQKRDQQQKDKEAHDKLAENSAKKEKEERDEQNKKDGDSKSDSDNQGNQGNQGGDPKEGDVENQADKLREALNNKEGKKPNEGQGDGKSDESKPGEGKPSEPAANPPPKPGEAKDDKQDKPGEAKGGQGEKPGESKGGEKAENGAEGKDQGKDDNKEGRGTPKPGDPGNGDKPGTGKDENDAAPKGEGKGKGTERPDKPAEGNPGESKPGEPMPGKDTPGEGKEGKPNDAARPDDKAGEGKPGAPAQPDKGDDKGEGKPGGPPEGTNEPKPSKGPPPPDAKPSDGKLAGDDPMNNGDKPGTGKPQDGKSQDGKGGTPPPPPPQPGDMGNGKGDAAPPMPGEAGMGKDGPPPPAGMGAGEMGKPPATPPMAGMPPAGADKPENPNGMGTAPGGDGGKPGEAKAAGSGPGKGEAPDAPPAKRERPVGSRATQLQLEDFRKSVGEDVLKEAKMSREQFERFLKDYSALADRRRQQEEERDNIRPGTPGSLPSSGGIGSPGPSGRENLPGAARPKPPSEYRDSYADFLRRLP
jgi:hypothetical protein